MNLNGMLNQFEGNAATMMFAAGMHYMQKGHVDTSTLDDQALAATLTAALSQLELEHPGLVAPFGWVQQDIPTTVSSGQLNASPASTPTK